MFGYGVDLIPSRTANARWNGKIGPEAAIERCRSHQALPNRWTKFLNSFDEILLFLEKVILIQPRLVENSAATGVEQPRHQNLDEIYPFSESSQSSGLGYVRMCSCYNSIQPRMSYSATTGSFPHVSKFIQPRMSYTQPRLVISLMYPSSFSRECHTQPRLIVSIFKSCLYPSWFSRE